MIQPQDKLNKLLTNSTNMERWNSEPCTYNGCGFLSVTMAAWLYSGDQLLTTTGREVSALLEMAADLTHSR